MSMKRFNFNIEKMLNENEIRSLYEAAMLYRQRDPHKDKCPDIPYVGRFDFLPVESPSYILVDDKGEYIEILAEMYKVKMWMNVYDKFPLKSGCEAISTVNMAEDPDIAAVKKAVRTVRSYLMFIANKDDPEQDAEQAEISMTDSDKKATPIGAWEKSGEPAATNYDQCLSECYDALRDYVEAIEEYIEVCEEEIMADNLNEAKKYIHMNNKKANV